MSVDGVGDPFVELRHVMEATPSTIHYCEENVYLLLANLAKGNGGFRSFGVFVSSYAAEFDMFGRNHDTEDIPDVCDYHAFVVAERGQACLVADPEHRRCPTGASSYLRGCFRGPEPIEARAPRFRVVPEHVLLRQFASDRRHMRTSARSDQGGSYLEPPPPHECVRAPTAASAHNLEEWIDVQPNTPSLRGPGDISHYLRPRGQVMELAQVIQWVESGAPEIHFPHNPTQNAYQLRQAFGFEE